MMAKGYIFMLSMRLSLELSEATSSSSSLLETSRRMCACNHIEAPKKLSVNHITSTSFLCKQIYMHVYASTLHMPFCFEGNKTPSGTLCRFFSRSGDWAISSTCHFVISKMIWSGEWERTGTTGLLRIECLVQQPKQTESHHFAWNLLKAARFSVLKRDDFLRHAVRPP